MDKRVFAWTVPADHPAFAGHFPGQPIVPGVVLLDHTILFAAEWLSERSDKNSPHWHVVNAKFLRPAGPGDALNFLLQKRANGDLSFRVSGMAGDVASGTLRLVQ